MRGPFIDRKGYWFEGAYCLFDSVTREAAGWVTISKCEGKNEREGCNWVDRELYRMNKDGYLVVDFNEISRTRGECGSPQRS
jgi:hypothetical protein